MSSPLLCGMSDLKWSEAIMVAVAEFGDIAQPGVIADLIGVKDTPAVREKIAAVGMDLVAAGRLNNATVDVGPGRAPGFYPVKNSLMAERVLADGPTRVVVDSGCYAVPPKMATVSADFIFVRDDGWSLGAPVRFAREAFDLWKSDWTCVVDVRLKSVMKVESFAALLDDPEFG